MCVFTHTQTDTCGTRTVVANCLIGGPNSLGGQGRERGGNLLPYDDIWGHIPNQRAWASIFSKASRIPSARFTPNASFSHWGTIGRLGELILMLENLLKWFSCHETFKNNGWIPLYTRCFLYNAKKKLNKHCTKMYKHYRCEEFIFNHFWCSWYFFAVY